MASCLNTFYWHLITPVTFCSALIKDEQTKERTRGSTGKAVTGSDLPVSRKKNE
jgi:hypothetical protein